MMVRLTWLLLFCLIGTSALPQPADDNRRELPQPATGDWREALRQWMTAEDMEEGYSEEAMELLETRAAERINLNQTSREELEQLPFLTAQEVEGLVEYLDRYRPVRSLNELRMVKSLDYDKRELLTHFVYVGDEQPRSVWPKLKDVMTHGRHTLMATAKVPFYDRRGDQNGYLGYKYRHDVRYQFSYQNRIKFGLTGAQDAGEPFFANRNAWGYDHYSYYLQLRDIGRLEELNVGMYRVQMGMGLVMNTAFQLGKLATLQSLGRSTHTLTAHSSRSAANYLRGAAATVRLSKSWRVTAFASYRDVDATLNSDGTARTLLTDGYHRTPTEMEKKSNTQRTDLGGSVGWRRGTLYVNANGVFTHLSRQLLPAKQNTPYRQYAAEGNDFFNASLDYGYNDHRWTVAGETAVNRQGAVAALHSVGCKLSDEWSVMVLHRYYDKRYTALHGRSFSEGGHVQNEHGVYLGAHWQPSRRWQLQGYADYAHFTWPRYQVSASSDAFDALLSARCQHRQWTVDGRYRYHIRQRNDSTKHYLANRTEQRLRLGIGYAATPQLSLRLQTDGVSVRMQGTSSYGIMVSEHASWQWRWLKVEEHAGWFHTDDYDSRLYQYERSVRYDFSFPMYYGHGLRYSLMLRATIARQLTATAKLGVTNYLDRSTIGSGLQQVVGHTSMTELLLQLRYIL